MAVFVGEHFKTHFCLYIKLRVIKNGVKRVKSLLDEIITKKRKTCSFPRCTRYKVG